MTAWLVLVCLISSPVVSSADAKPDIETTIYECERGAIVYATYINDDEHSSAVIHAEGQQIGLHHTRSASGAKYAQAPDGVGYVWWTKGEEAFLAWEDLPNCIDETLLSQCVAR